MKLPVSKTFLFSFLAALAILAANAFVSYRTVEGLVTTSQGIEHSVLALEALRDLQSFMRRDEAERRALIATEDPEHLARSRDLIESGQVALKTVRELWAERQSSALAELDALMAAEARKIARLENLYRRVRFDEAAPPDAAAIAPARDIPAVITQLIATEEETLTREARRSRDSSGVSRVTAAVSTVFSVLLLGFVLYLVWREIRERRQAEIALTFTATHDPLTKLPNRILLAERLDRALLSAGATRKRLAVLFIDLDRFKNINDTAGHETGDRLLQEITGRLLACAGERNLLARQGGDEFVLLANESAEAGHLAGVAQSMLDAIARPVSLYGREFHVTASIGISTYPDDGGDLRELLKKADIAMYRAKERGKNNYQFYSSAIDTHSFERLDLEAALHRALGNDELRLHYQPKVDTRTGRLAGAEALLRWARPERGEVATDLLVSTAEELGLIVPIGRWALAQACAQGREWRQRGLPPLRIAVNVSARQFASGVTLVDDVRAALGASGLPPQSLELEITESTVMHDPQRAIALMRELKAMGVRLAIDDFGTGYSSLAYLKRFPVDCVKLDQSFVRGVPGDASDVTIVSTIIDMAHRLRLSVVAEGVENARQADFLRVHGCDELQGYHVGKPLAAEEMAGRLDRDAARAHAGT